MPSLKYFLPQRSKNLPTMAAPGQNLPQERPHRRSETLNADIDGFVVKRIHDCALARWTTSADGSSDDTCPAASAVHLHPRRVRAGISKSSSRSRSQSRPRRGQGGSRSFDLAEKKNVPPDAPSLGKSRPPRSSGRTRKDPSRTEKRARSLNPSVGRCSRLSTRRSNLQPREVKEKHRRNHKNDEPSSRTCSRSVSPCPPVRLRRNKIMSNAA